ncbi:hypothetical protein J2X63_002462 [Agromyces sp. 3263]|uniref:hypothetical protein n=1 Tax=Agromyces sp. 3263 TaxID=2817750 RepID=UPI002861290B|nr:hypothetical protein [Agromyces sp. 3263]MDR6906776.1 hypothetical protein [Agromyces sp. 3263]
MGAMRIAFARAAARAGVLGSIAAVVFLLAGLGTAVVDSVSGAATTGLREGLAAASGADGAARWQIRVAADPDAQAEAAASVLDRMLTRHGATWRRSVETAPVDAVADGQAFGAVLLADEGVPERAELLTGAWPGDAQADAAAAEADALPATLHADAASALGLQPGDLVELQDGDGPERLLVVGTWRPLDANEPAWFGEPVIATGTVPGGAGPFVVGDDALVDLPAATIVRWTALPDAAGATPDQAAALRAVLPDVEPALRAEDAIGADGLSTSGGLDATLDRLLAGLGAVRAIAPLPILLLAFAGFAALDRLAALLGAARRGETVLLRARGASASRLARDTAVEVLVVGIPAAALGAAAGEAVLAVARPGEARSWQLAVLVASIALVGALLLAAGRAWRDATRPVVRGAGDEVGRAPRAAAAGAVVLVAVAAAVSLWQFRLYGSPLVASASGTPEVDPVAVLAPMLVLLALSLAALGLARPAGSLLERMGARSPGLVPSLPMRQLARRAELYASASLVVMLGVSGLTLAAAFAGSWQAFDREAAAIATGGDVRVSFAGRDVVQGADPLALADPFAGVDGVGASGAVYRGEARIGSDAAALVALPADRLAGIAPGAASAADIAELDDLIASGRAAAPALPAGADAVTAGVGIEAAAGTPGTVTVSAWVLGPSGEASRLPGVAFPVAAGGGTAELQLPDAAPLRLLGFEAALAGSQGAGPVTVAIDDVRVEGGADADGDDGNGADGAPASASGDVELTATAPSGRVVATAPDVASASDDAHPVPVLLGEALAARIQAKPGDPLAFRMLTGGADVDAVVAGVVPAVPGAGDLGILVDLGALSAAAFSGDAGVPQYTERWLATDGPQALAERLGRERSTAFTVATRADASSSGLIQPAVTALWAGAAGALLFALVSLVALVAALGRARLGEVVVLRVLGSPARVQARARFAELVAAVGAATLVGIAVGAVTAWVTARELARASVAGAPGALAVPVDLAWLPWAAGLLAFLAACAAVGGGAAASVGRLASRPGLRAEDA